MCKAASQGGQRCPSSARNRIAAAERALTLAQEACAALDATTPDLSTPESTQVARVLRRATFGARRDAEDAVREAKAVYASTPAGEAEYEAEIDALVADDSIDFAEACNREMELRHILHRGRELREVNATVAKACTGD